MTIICACAVCRQDIIEGDPMADNKVFKCGELSYIELAHKTCGIADNERRRREGWNLVWEHD